MMQRAMDSVERRGEVVGFENGVAHVRMEPEPGCSACGSRSSCSTGKASQMVKLSLPNGTKIGDQVALSIPAASITRAALIGYLLPLLAMVLGALIGSFLFGGDAAAVLGAGIGFFAGLLLVRLISRRFYAQGLTPFTCESDLQPFLNADHLARFKPGETS